MENEYNPDWVSPPGETINDLLTEQMLTVLDLANALDISTRDAWGLISGHTVIDLCMADRLQNLFQVPSHFWLNREAAYRNL